MIVIMIVITCKHHTGLLASVRNLRAEGSSSSIAISWSAPFSILPDIWYTVHISRWRVVVVEVLSGTECTVRATSLNAPPTSLV